ncbi:hypothetical protein A4X13_0g8332 [Tilletia indica]|uniref:Uncharacterized protein n=1 Tax=Tilletia indica TaxID=43049 RepID=A0A177TGT9_9BASI|nr:hypothetical protein A4X13_0g8332 [Tilletia indica]
MSSLLSVDLWESEFSDIEQLLESQQPSRASDARDVEETSSSTQEDIDDDLSDSDMRSLDSFDTHATTITDSEMDDDSTELVLHTQARDQISSKGKEKAQESHWANADCCKEPSIEERIVCAAFAIMAAQDADQASTAPGPSSQGDVPQGSTAKASPSKPVALDAWFEIGRNAGFCKCRTDTVQMDVEAFLREAFEEDGAWAKKEREDAEKKENARLEDENARLREENAQLKKDSARLTEENARLRKESTAAGKGKRKASDAGLGGVPGTSAGVEATAAPVRGGSSSPTHLTEEGDSDVAALAAAFRCLRIGALDADDAMAVDLPTSSPEVEKAEAIRRALALREECLALEPMSPINVRAGGHGEVWEALLLEIHDVPGGEDAVRAGMEPTTNGAIEVLYEGDIHWIEWGQIEFGVSGTGTGVGGANGVGLSGDPTSRLLTVDGVLQDPTLGATPFPLPPTDSSASTAPMASTVEFGGAGMESDDGGVVSRGLRRDPMAWLMTSPGVPQGPLQSTASLSLPPNNSTASTSRPPAPATTMAQSHRNRRAWRKPQVNPPTDAIPPAPAPAMARSYRNLTAGQHPPGPQRYHPYRRRS